MKKNTLVMVILLLLIIIVATGCAQSVPMDQYYNIKVYGFWNGLWHGMILPFSFIGSLISDNIIIYSVSNNGGWYDFGFVLGLGGVTGSSTQL